MFKMIIRKKRLLQALAIAVAVSASCSATETPEKENLEPSVHLLVEGKPFLMIGAQLRTDYLLQLEKKTPEELEPYFQLTANTNILAVSVPIAWRDIEKEKDEYDISLVKKYIDYCDKYSMKLELLWYGSYMCGYSVEGYIPDYVISDTGTYPELNPDAAFQGWLGKQFYLKPNVPALTERESKALGKMMDLIAEYDRKNGSRHTVIGIQIENEPDMLATRHNSETGYSPQRIWPDLIEMIDKLGQTVKASPYDCYTRVNMTTTYSDYNARAGEIMACDGIDYVGIDPYENGLFNIELKLKWLMNLKGNYAHIAENGGEFANNDVLMMKAVSMGCGYEIFEVITTAHEYLKDWTLRGLYNPDFTPKAHTANIADAFKIFRDGWVDLASADPDNILGFNIKKDSGENQTSEQRQTSSCKVKWSTHDRGIAYAVENDSYLSIASTKNDIIVLSGDLASEAETGYYGLDRKWVKTGLAALSGNTIHLNPCTVYRIKIKK